MTKPPWRALFWDGSASISWVTVVGEAVGLRQMAGVGVGVTHGLEQGGRVVGGRARPRMRRTMVPGTLPFRPAARPADGPEAGALGVTPPCPQASCRILLQVVATLKEVF